MTSDAMPEDTLPSLLMPAYAPTPTHHHHHQARKLVWPDGGREAVWKTRSPLVEHQDPLPHRDTHAPQIHATVSARC